MGGIEEKMGTVVWWMQRFMQNWKTRELSAVPEDDSLDLVYLMATNGSVKRISAVKLQHYMKLQKEIVKMDESQSF